MVPLWLAFEQGIFHEQGLDAELVFLSSVRTDQGVITGDTPIGYGANVVATRLSGADIVAIAGVANHIAYTLFGRPGLSSPQDLRGKTMAVTQPGASNTLAAYITLRHFGLEPQREVALQPTPGSAEQLAMLGQGLSDAALFSPPADDKARELGLVPLADMKALNIPFLLTGIGTSGAYAASHTEEVRRFLRGYVVGVARARHDTEAALAVTAKYTQTEDPAIVEAAYRYYRDLWARPDFRVPPEAIASVLGVLDVPGVETAKPEDFIDNRFVDELHQSGFIRQVAPFD
jgi:ABC-type nitrate/sulfonate/bicarbonate transport system substrate-binding protein